MLSKIAGMLEEMAHDLSIFHEYEWLFKENSRLEDTLINVFVEVIKFWFHTVRFLRRSSIGKNANFHGRQDILREIREKLNHNSEEPVFQS